MSGGIPILVIFLVIMVAPVSPPSQDSASHFGSKYTAVLLALYIIAIARHSIHSSEAFVPWLPYGPHGEKTKCLERGEVTLLDHGVYYMRDIRVWMPDLEFGLLHGTPACPPCGRGDRNICAYCYPKHHRGRRIFTFDTHYWLMSRQCIYNDCQRKSQKEETPIKRSSTLFWDTMRIQCFISPTILHERFPCVKSQTRS
jgi:hypothetical protein